MKKLLFVFILFSLYTYIIFNREVRKQPVIGIFTLPSTNSQYPQPLHSFIKQTYINYLEQAGALIIPIPFDADEDTLIHLFNRINGLLFTGGAVYLPIDVPLVNRTESYNLYTYSAAFLVSLALEANYNGDYFPIWGTCQGFQLLHYIISGFKYDILVNIDNEKNISRPGFFLDNANMYQSMPKHLKDYASQHSALFYNHNLMIQEKSYNKYEELRNFFKITGYSINSTSFSNPEGLRFIASVEGKKYPFYATLYHPEIQQFEQFVNTDKSNEASEISQYLAHFFVEKTRLNTHYFENLQELQTLLIDNFEPIQPNITKYYTYFFSAYDFPNVTLHSKCYLDEKLNQKNYYFYS